MLCVLEEGNSVVCIVMQLLSFFGPLLYVQPQVSPDKP